MGKQRNDKMSIKVFSLSSVKSNAAGWRGVDSLLRDGVASLFSRAVQRVFSLTLVQGRALFPMCSSVRLDART